MSDGIWRRVRESATATAVAARLPESMRGVVAAVVRGDALAPVTTRVQRALAEPEPGTVPFGPMLRPLSATVLESFDAHAHAAMTFDTAVRTLSGADVELVCSPPLSAAARQLVVRPRDAARAAGALARTLTGSGWYAQRLRAGKPAGRPVATSSQEWLPWVADGGVRLFRAVAAAGGTLLGAAELGVDVLAWRAIKVRTPRRDEGMWEPGTLVAPARNDWADYLPPSAWTDAAADPTHVPSALRAPSPFTVTEPIDAVFTWVDSDDPQWRARRDAAEPASGQHHPGALDPARFESADELRYALRSVHYYASWVRQIFVVTAGQVPDWLDREHPGVRIVDHREIFPAGSPPVFNSHAIESRLHHIPGLSEHYLYLNDDVMFGRRAFPEDFYVGDALIRFGTSAHLLDPSPPTVADPPIMAAAKNGRSLLEERFGRTVRHKVRHTVHPQLRSIVAEMEEQFPEAFAEVAGSTFRSYRDISVAASLQLWYAAALGRAVPGEVDLLFLDVGSSAAPRTLDALLTTRRHQVMCLNASRIGPHRDRDVARLRHFLERYYPVPAPWERAVSAPSSTPDARSAPVDAPPPARPSAQR